jgi:monoamine oxidase
MHDLAREKHDVVIVGAGLSGLTCARALAAAGVRPVVVEARDRVGGRTMSRPLGRATFDLGGQWLGARQPRLAALAEELSVETFPQYSSGEKILDVRGRRSTYRGTIPSLAPWRLAELHFVLQRIEGLTKRTVLGDPLASPDAALHDGCTLEEWTRRNVVSRTVQSIMASAIRTVFGAEPRDLSMLFFLSYLRSGGGLMSLVEIENGAQERRFVRGAQELSERLAARLKGEGDGEGRVALRAPVRAIEQTSDGVVVRTGAGDFRGRFAVVAVPPALAGRIAFDPPLPALRDQLMQRSPMGSTVKCFALYDRAFWREQGLSGEAVCDGAPISVVFDATSHDGAQPALVAFLVGQAAREWSSRPDGERRRAVLSTLTRLFGSRAERPVGYVEQDWSTEAYSRGCPTGTMVPGALSACAPALRRPCGRVHWAGTETAVHWTGYMEGAIEAGERAAQEILARAPRA